MKKFAFLLVLIGLWSFCAGCAPAVVPTGNATYTAPDDSYTITLPGTWGVMFNTAEGWKTVSERPLTDEQQANLQALAEAQNAEIANLAALDFDADEAEPTAALVLMALAAPDYPLEGVIVDYEDFAAYWEIDVQDMEIFDVSGYPGFYAIGWTPNAVTVRQEILVDEVEYRFVLSAAPASFDLHQATYLEILGSFMPQP